MKKKNSFTLIELLIVIVIIGILASIAVPNYTKMVEKAKADQAITYLKVIRTGEKIYSAASNGKYVTCPNAAAIKDTLGAEVTEENYTFWVTLTDPDGKKFLATAKRKTNDKTIRIDEEGKWSGDSPYVPPNP